MFICSQTTSLRSFPHPFVLLEEDDYPSPLPDEAYPTKEEWIGEHLCTMEVCQVMNLSKNQGKACVPVVGQDGPVVEHHIDTSPAGTGQQNIFYPFLLENKSVTLTLSCIQ